MKKLRTVTVSVLRWIWRQKFYSFCILMVANMCVFGEYSLLQISRLRRQEAALKSEIAVYKDSIEAFNHRIEEVSANEEELERFAREQLRMHRDNEDLYLIGK